MQLVQKSAALLKRTQFTVAEDTPRANWFQRAFCVVLDFFIAMFAALFVLVPLQMVVGEETLNSAFGLTGHPRHEYWIADRIEKRHKYIGIRSCHLPVALAITICLAELTTIVWIPQVMPMIAHEYNKRILRQPEQINGINQTTEPAINHRAFTSIKCTQLVEF